MPESMRQGLANLRFEKARAQDFAGSDFDLITIFDAFHDMGDPVGAVAHARQNRAESATAHMMLVEPKAGDTPC